MDWKAIATAVVIALAGNGGIIWLVVKYWLRGKTAAFETELKRAYVRDIEAFKADLRIAAEHKQTQYQLLQVKRAEVIAELYDLLEDFHYQIAQLVEVLERGGAPTKEERVDLANEAIQKFNKFYASHRIYFSKELCTRIEGWRVALIKLGFRFTGAYFVDRVVPPEKTADEMLNIWNDLQDKAQPLKSEIEDEFRKLLGVTENQEHKE
jgi:hypothetical protein